MVKVVINNLPAQDLEIMGLIPLSDKGKPGGVAELGADGKVPPDQFPFSGLPTLEELGAEPAGARAYTDEKFKSPTWMPVTGFQNGWSNYGSGLPNAAYCLDSLKILRLMGVISGPATAFLPVFILPVGFCPPSLKGWRAFSPDPLAYLLIQADGQVLVSCTAAGGGYIYLDNIVFPIY